MCVGLALSMAGETDSPRSSCARRHEDLLAAWERLLPAQPQMSSIHRQLLLSGERLMLDARRACRREGVVPTDAELHARVGARIGLASEDVTRCLRRMLGEPSEAPEAAAILHLDHPRLRARVVALANEILGARERKVFLARYAPGERDLASVDRLAAAVGVSPARIHELEVSARRKIAVALAYDGLPGGALPSLPRPRRATPAPPPVMDLPLPAR